MATDPIADFINALKIGSRAKKAQVTVPYSRVKESIAEVLKTEKFIADFAKVNDKGASKSKKSDIVKSMTVDLAYEVDGSPKISDAIRFSKPSKRVYLGSAEIYPVRQGYGRMIVSTSKGILTDIKARKEKVGGEPLFKIW